MGYAMGEIKIIDELLLLLALTTDSFVVSFAYGMTRTKMPFWIVAGMNLIMSALLGMAVLAGNFLYTVLPQSLPQWLGILLLTLLGMYRILGFFLKKEKNTGSIKLLTPGEGFILAFVLSADSLAAGIGTGLLQSGELLLAVGAFFAGIAMMKAGWFLGSRIQKTAKRDFSWISGVCLLLLALGIFCRA